MEHCVICKAHPKPKYPGDTRHICSACEDPTITIKGPHEITKKTGLLQGEMDDLIYGYSRNLKSQKYWASFNKVNRFYSIKSIISVAEKKFKGDAKRLKKLEKFKQSWADSVTAKADNDSRKSKLLDNVKLNIQKFDTTIDFNDVMVKGIINDVFRDCGLTNEKIIHMDGDTIPNNPTDEQIIHLLTTELENHTYYLARKASLDKLIDEQVPEYYRPIIREMIEYDDYVHAYYKTDEHLVEIYDLLYNKYKLQEAKDDREKALTAYMNGITKEHTLTAKLLTLEPFLSTFNAYVTDNIGQFADVCNTMHEAAKPVIEKYHQVMKLKDDLVKWDINVSVYLGNTSAKVTTVPKN
jgi:hypothetical protein